MPSHSGYEALAQQSDDAAHDTSFDDLDETDDLLPTPVTAASSNGRAKNKRLSRQGAPRSIDLGKLDTAFKRWTENIAARVQIKRKKKITSTGDRKEIVKSVFVREDGEEDVFKPVPPGWVSCSILLRVVNS
jgi:phosphatidylinositol 4-kinase type 2